MCSTEGDGCRLLVGERHYGFAGRPLTTLRSANDHGRLVPFDIREDVPEKIVIMVDEFITNICDGFYWDKDRVKQKRQYRQHLQHTKR